MTEMIELNNSATSADTRRAVYRSTLRSVIAIVALFLMTLATYSRAMTGGFIWDDDNYVQNNATLRNLDGLQKIWREPPTRTQYYPIVLTSFWIDYHLWGLHPTGYHVVNVLLQFANAALLWVLLRRLAVPGAWVAAAIFAVHPLQVETVAWIAERKNLLSGTFYFLSLMVYLRFCGVTPAPEQATNLDPDAPEPWWQLPADPTRLYVLAIFLFACALLSKSVTATLPVAVLLIIWWKRGRITLKDFTPLIPLLAMGIAMGSLTSFFESRLIGPKGDAWQLAPTHAGDFLVRCIVAGRAIWFYAFKLIAPFPLIFNYPRWVISPESVAQYFFPISVLVIVVTLWLTRQRIGRGPLAGVGFFIVTLAPALCFVNFVPMRYSFVADHFQYLAGIGLIVVLVAAIKLGLDRLVQMEALNPLVVPVASSALLIGFAGLSVSHSGSFHDLETLWRSTLEATQQKSWLAANDYGVFLKQRDHPGDREAARGWFEKTLRLNPGNAEARYNLGKLAAESGRYAEALQYFNESMAQSPPYPDSEFEAVQMLMRLNRTDDALAAAVELVKHNPQNDQAHGTLGMLLARHGRIDEAMDEYSAAVDLAPDSPIAHFNYASALARVGRLPEARDEFAKTIELDHENPTFINGFGTYWLMAGNYDTAAKLFQKAIETDPKFVDAYLNLGLVDQQELRLDESEKVLQQAADLDPKDARIASALKRTREWIADPSKRPTTRASTLAATRAAAATQATTQSAPR